MELRIEQLDDGISRITPIGRWDTHAAALLRPQLRAIMEGTRRVIMDMSQVDFLTSIGIGTLIMAARAAAQGGGKLVILSPTPHVAETIGNARVNRIIPVFFDLAHATDELKSDRQRDLDDPR